MKQIITKIHKFFFPEIINRPIYAKEYGKLFLLSIIRSIGWFTILSIISTVYFTLVGYRFLLTILLWSLLVPWIGYGLYWGFFINKNRFKALGYKHYEYLGVYFPVLNLLFLLFQRRVDFKLFGIYLIGIPIFFDREMKRKIGRYKNSLKTSFYKEILELKHKGANYNEIEIKEKYQKLLYEYIERERLAFLQEQKGNISLNKDIVHMDLDRFYKEENEIFNLQINYPEIAKIDF